MNKYGIYGIGSALVDIEVDVKDDDLQHYGLDKGRMQLLNQIQLNHLSEQIGINIASSKRACGGSAANTVISYAHFGGSAFFSCQLGADDNGQFFTKAMQQAKVDSNISDKTSNRLAGTTGQCLVLITADGERTMNTFLGLSETMHQDCINTQALSNSDYLYVESYLVSSDINFATVKHAFELAHQADVKIVLSLSDPAIVAHYRTQIETLIAMGVHTVFCNEDEAIAYNNENKNDSQGLKLQAQVPHVVITRGAKGASIYHQQEHIAIEAIRPTQVVDCNGAGDIFAGAYLYAISHNKSKAEAGAYAARCASCLVAQYGPRLSAAQHKELLKAL